MASKLAPDATIADVVTTLQKPEEYVRVVLANMSACKRIHGNAMVKIGITGLGQVPYHKISYVAPGGDEELFDAFDGKHRFEGVEVGTARWSTATMSFEEVQTLLADIRGYTPNSSR